MLKQVQHDEKVAGTLILNRRYLTNPKIVKRNRKLSTTLGTPLVWQ